MVSYFSDPGATIPIPNPGAYTNSSTTVYAVVEDGGCTSDPATVTLTVVPAPVAIGTATSICDQGGNMAVVDLTTLDGAINGGTANPVSWFLDPAGTNPIATPGSFMTGTTIVYAQVSSGGCVSAVIPIPVTINPAPDVFSNSLEICDQGGGFATFDLTTLNGFVSGGQPFTVNWFQDPGFTTQILNPNAFNSMSTTVFAQIVNPQNCSSAPGPVDLIVLPAPVASTATLEACDNGTGQAIFDLTTANLTINSGTGQMVNWYLDPTGNLPVVDPTFFSSGSTLVYASVEGANGCESALTPVTLLVSPLPIANNPTLSICDDGSGQATFNLNALAIDVNGGSGFPVDWYFDPAATNPIPNPGAFTTSTTQVYATVFDGDCTSLPAPVTLEVLPQPTALAVPPYTLCDQGSGQATFDLTTLETPITGGTGDAVDWYFDFGTTLPIVDPTLVFTTTTIVFAVVNNGSCTSSPLAIDLIVTPAPITLPTSLEACDEGGNTATFDLTSVDNTSKCWSGISRELVAG
jgi:hypothetical protein